MPYPTAGAMLEVESGSRLGPWPVRVYGPASSAQPSPEGEGQWTRSFSATFTAFCALFTPRMQTPLNVHPRRPSGASCLRAVVPFLISSGLI